MNKSSIRTRLILLMLAATVIPIVISMIVTYFYTTRSVGTKLIQENANLIYQGKTNVQAYMDTLNRNSLSLYNDPGILLMLRRNVHDYTNEAQTYTLLQNMTHSVDGIYQIYFYMAKARRSTLLIGDIPKRGYDTDNFSEPYTTGNPSSVVEPTHMSSIYGLGQSPPYYDPRPVITLHRAIYNVPTTEWVGTLSIDIKLEAIQDIADQLFNKQHERLYLLDQSGMVVYSGDSALIGKPLSDDWTGPILESKEARGQLELNKSVYLYEKMDTPYMKWTLVKEIPHSYLYEGARSLTQINIIIAAVSLLLVIAATLFVTIRITAPIKKLIGTINQIQAGNLTARVDGEGQDEIGILVRRFRTMMETINNLILREYRLNIANKTNQLKALQAQINPHFMNNALQSIGTLALQHNVPRIYSLINSLAKMMRYSMNTNQEAVPLSMEIGHVKAYLALQEERFEGKFRTDFELDEAALGIEVPKMIVQPLVENYFKHGFDPKLGPGHLTVRVRLEPGGETGPGEVPLKPGGGAGSGGIGAESGPAAGADAALRNAPESRPDEDSAAADVSPASGGLRARPVLFVEVEDNGRGIPEDKLTELQAGLAVMREETGMDEEGGIGIGNVRTRLRLYFDPQASLTLENTDPHGVRITMRIPLGEDTTT
ncbi:histidine kinase [Paenibacillus chitinolyticus]|uniref:cache domain-containing sensor histidine kinase n=1 Tax=Paenibacillus chitinolyticus TaxID=79263 RepID=UPI002DBBA63E|nr:histidine kinase [Paenibacillus chitinolyticus]MEC0247874.1 histidine kinase [Paenibacillus chitinolyticus]